MPGSCPQNIGRTQKEPRNKSELFKLFHIYRLFVFRKLYLKENGTFLKINVG